MPMGFDRATAVICTIAILNTMGLGLIMPVMPELLAGFQGGSIARAAAIGGYLSLVFAAMQFVFSPILGALSDRYGRRPILLGSLALASADYLMMAMAPYLWVIFLGRMLSGASSATFSVANAYLADRSSKEDRTKFFGYVGAAAGIGFVMGPFIGGLLGTYGPRAPFYAASALSLLTLVGTILYVQESLPGENRRPITWKIINPLGPLLSPLQGVSLALLAVYFFDALAGFAFSAVWAYFGAARYGWNSTTIGLSFSIIGICFVLTQAVILGPVAKRIGNLNVAALGLSLGIAGFLTLVWLQSGLFALMLLPVFAFRAIVGITIVGQTSAQVDPDRQGELQGRFASLGALASLISFPMMTQLFASQLSNGGSANTWHSGAPFLLAAGLGGIALLLLIVTIKPGPATTGCQASKKAH
ncbi:MFS transporter [Pseudohalocynthiibacter aestuariivivens]|uniref:MFS transporter n=1 Tax=Pseudohalocynthiibacter aestuariivivens TaxID=1591409 RepID=A0ABV5JHK8_9RHOB|nr:MFS transporter [Pseudohalocynthiibacter aestuariivivens]MBS9718521.1 MFS transporter [Pseudohalocynthiibacter aestuariivivens]